MMAVPGTIEFENTNYTVNEDGTVVAAVTLIRNGGSNGAVSVRVTPSDGTATAGNDYVNNPITVNFADGETSKIVNIPIINDALLENNETINLSLSNPTGGVSIGGQNTTVFTIIDNDLKPALTIDIAANSVNESDGTVTATITRNTATNTALEVSLTSSDNTEITTPAKVTIPVGVSSVTVDLSVIDDTIIDTAQNVTLIATASGFTSDTDKISVINNDTVNLTLNLNQTEISENGGIATATITRDVVTNRPLTVQLTGSDGVTLPDKITIAANQASATFEVEAIDNGELSANQTVSITATPLYEETSIAIDNLAVTTNLNIIDDESSSLKVDIDRSMIAETGSATVTVTRNTDTTEALTVNLTSSNTTEATVPTTVTIEAGETSATTIITGIDDGVSDGSQPVTISASATGLNIGKATLDVTDIEVPDLTITQLNANPGYSNQKAQFTYKVENQGLQNLSGIWKDRVYLSTDKKLDASDKLLTEFEVDANIQVGQFYERTVSYFNPRTPGEYYLIATTDADNQIDEGNGLGEKNNTVINPFTVVPTYSAEVSTNTEVGIAGESIIFKGFARSNQDNSPIPFEFVTIEVENNGFTRELSGFTDKDGNFTRSFTPLSGEAGTFNVRAFFPDNIGEDAGYEDSFKILGTKLDTKNANHKIITDTPFTASVGLENLTDTALTGFTYNVTSLPDNWDVQVNLPTDLAGDSTNTISYTVIAPNNSAITQDTFNINLTSTEGVTANLPVTISLERNIPRLVADTSQIKGGMLRGEQTFVEFELTNEGGAVAENIEVLLPDAPWLNLATTDTIESLAPGESTNVTLALTPDSNLDLNEYTGNIVFDAAGNDGDLSLGFNFRAVSEATGNLFVNVVDELFYFAEGSPKLSDAKVIVRDYFTQVEIGRMTTDETGMVNFEGLAEGYYTLEVKAEDHSTFSQNIKIDAGETETINSFLSLETVQYTWTVTETEIQDRYNITVESVFETDVPLPTVTIEPASVDLADLEVVGQVKQIEMTFTNHGLIAANDLALNLGSHPFYKIEPLLDEIGSLDAKSSITVSVRITRIADFDTLNTLGGELSLQSTPNVPCGISVGINYSYTCGSQQIQRAIPIPFFNVAGNCKSPIPGNTGPNGGGGGGLIIRGGNGGWGSPTIITPPPMIQSTPSNCDPCKEQNKQAVTCLLLNLGSRVKGPVGRVVKGINCWANIANAIKNVKDGNLLDLPKPKEICDPPGIPDCLKQFCFSGLGGSGGLGGNLGRSSLTDNLSLASLTPSATASGTVNSGLLTLQRYIGYWDVIGEVALNYYGDSVWLEVSDENQPLLESWHNAFQELAQGETITDYQISEAERNQLLSLDFPQPLSADDIDKFIARWNRSIDYYSQGILSADDLNSAQNPNFMDIDKLQALQADVDNFMAVLAEEGYEGLYEATFDIAETLDAALNGEGGVCAKVRIQINQEAVMTRSAFLGELIIENTSDTVNLEDITINLEIIDENGNIVNELFGINDPILENLGAVDGSGFLNTNSTGSAEWTFIPTKSAAGENPQQYTIGGTLSYLQDGQLVTVPLISTPIEVLPQAELTVDYFQSRNVFGDDPFTDVVEVSEPFSLGLLIKNQGFGDARNLSINSAQPKIVDNEKGLLIDFDIIGSQVNGKGIEPTLSVDFGNIEAGGTAVGEWLLKSSLQGKFTDYKATFEHVNNLGIEELSLIKEVNIHELIQTVQADGDGLSDFLVNDEFDKNFYADTLYFSNGNTAPVTAIDEVIVDAPVSILDLEANISKPKSFPRTAITNHIYVSMSIIDYSKYN